jgi:hypothetical protein
LLEGQAIYAEGLGQGQHIEPPRFALPQLPLNDGPDGNAGGVGELLSAQPRPFAQLSNPVSEFHLLRVFLGHVFTLKKIWKIFSTEVDTITQLSIIPLYSTEYGKATAL